MKTILIWLLILYVIQIITLIILGYFNPNKPSTVSELIDELKSIHWSAWIPLFGLVIVILALIFTGFDYLWEKFLDLKIRR